jgi:hypothetical protein|tara:strand:- start:73 stop:618 length:546 start_codon:yes stop_codon:yes gene_type:complete
MAVQIQGTLNTVKGPTTSSYFRIEHFKVKPWVGEVEYNPMLFNSAEDAGMSRIQFYGDELPNILLTPLLELSLVSGSENLEFELPELITFPLTGALEDVTINHYTQSLTSQSVEVTDYDEDGNETVTTETQYWHDQVIYSQSIEEKNPIDLAGLGDIYNKCYTHFKSIIAENLPSANILDI